MFTYAPLYYAPAHHPHHHAQVRAAGMLVAVERGGCSFSMKTLAAQRAGAVGVIIVNTAEATLRVMADAGDGEKAVIPTVM